MAATFMAALLPIAAVCTAQVLANAAASIAEGKHWHRHHPRHARHRGNR